MFAVSTIELTLRMLVSLALVSGALLLITRFTRSRFRLGGPRATIDVQGRHQLTKSSSIALVRAGQRHLLVGVNDHAITLLAEGDDLVDDLIDNGETAGSEDNTDPVVDVRNGESKQLRGKTDKSGARKRRRGTGSLAPAGMGVIEALREKSVRRS